METKEDGGPAFPMPSGPEPRVNATTHYNEGMSLRDYFASKALVGLLASDAHPDIVCETLMATQDGIDARAVFAFKLADAMLRARARGGAGQ